MDELTSKRNERIINKIFTPIDFFLMIAGPIGLYVLHSFGVI